MLESIKIHLRYTKIGLHYLIIKSYGILIYRFNDCSDGSMIFLVGGDANSQPMILLKNG